MIFIREICEELKKHSNHKQITVITGMRRTGKTTLIKWLLEQVPSENKLYIDLERIDNRELFDVKNYDAITASLTRRGLSFTEKVYLALDEIQLTPNIASAIKYLYDSYDIKFFITGSSSYYLKNLFSESLAGRKKIFELYPLSFGEFLQFKNIPFQSVSFFDVSFLSDEYDRLAEYYEEYIQFGGFPEVVLASSSDDKRDLVADIVSSYVNIDIKTLADFRSQHDIYSLMKMLASRVGSRLDYSKLSRLSGIPRAALQNYIDLFEKTYLIARISVVSKNSDREIVKAKKLYFSDTGILNHLADVSSGAQFENTVFNQLRAKGEVAYYALKTGDEIDFILNRSTALEVKESPIDQDKRTLERLAKNIAITQCRLIGRKAVPNFSSYIWGGCIR